jgi:hypothetical protein
VDDVQIAEMFRMLQDNADRYVLSDRQLPVRIWRPDAAPRAQDLLWLTEDCDEPVKASRLADHLHYGIQLFLYDRTWSTCQTVTAAHLASSLRKSLGQVIVLTGATLGE